MEPSDAADSGVSLLSSLVADLNFIGVAFVTVVLAGVIWAVVEFYARKAAGG